MTADERVTVESDRTALASLDGDGHRPERNPDPYALAQELLGWHGDLALCYCRACVISRALLSEPEVQSLRAIIRAKGLLLEGAHGFATRVAAASCDAPLPPELYAEAARVLAALGSGQASRLEAGE